MHTRILIVSVSTLHNLYYYYAACMHAQFLQVRRVYWGVLPAVLHGTSAEGLHFSACYYVLIAIVER